MSQEHPYKHTRNKANAGYLLVVGTRTLGHEDPSEASWSSLTPPLWVISFLRVNTDHSPHAPEKGNSAFPADGASSKEMVAAGP